MECVFCQFLKGEKKEHSNGLPFKILNETKRTISFLSNVLPETEDGHILVIPKKHYATSIEDIPKSTLHELIEHVTLLAKALRKKHEGCNILLNDGNAAGQTVFHTHFHLIPRDIKDKIKIEIYKRKKMKKEEFLKLHLAIKRTLKDLG